MAWEETTTLGTRKCGFQHAISSLESTNNYVGACKCTDGKYENQYGQCVLYVKCGRYGQYGKYGLYGTYGLHGLSGLAIR